MTLLAFALAGWLAGWLITLASDTLPRFARSRPTLPAVPYRPALLAWRRGTRPSRLHLAAEIGSAAFFAYLGTRFGLSWDGLALAAGFTFLLLVTLVDLKYRLILNVVTYPAIILVGLAHLLLADRPLLSIALGGGMAFGIFLLTAMLRPGDLGGGDVKLAALIGLLFGFPGMLWALIVGAGAGGLMAVYLLRSGHNGQTTIPYAPFLCLGALVALLYNPFALAG